MATSFNYSIANDTANGALSGADLKSEIESSSITIALNDVSSAGDTLTINFKANLSAGEETTLNGVVSAHTGVITKSAEPVEVEVTPPFANKKLTDGRSLFKRVHGANATISANSTGTIDITVPYSEVKFTGAAIINCAVGDTVDFTVHDTYNNDISGLDTGTYGNNVQLNQFGYDVEMSKDFYENTSQYDASLYQNMIVRCSYTNNDANNSRYVAVNFEMHEVKA